MNDAQIAIFAGGIFGLVLTIIGLLIFRIWEIEEMRFRHSQLARYSIFLDSLVEDKF